MFIVAYSPPIAIVAPLTGFFGPVPVIEAYPLGGGAPPADPGVGYVF